MKHVPEVANWKEADLTHYKAVDRSATLDRIVLLRNFLTALLARTIQSFTPLLSAAGLGRMLTGRGKRGKHIPVERAMGMSLAS